MNVETSYATPRGLRAHGSSGKGPPPMRGGGAPSGNGRGGVLPEPQQEGIHPGRDTAVPPPRNAQSEFLPLSLATRGNGSSYTCHGSAVRLRRCSPPSLRVPIRKRGVSPSEGATWQTDHLAGAEWTLMTTDDTCCKGRLLSQELHLH